MKSKGATTKLLRIFYSIGFFFTVHFAVLEFINSSYLKQFFGTGFVGLIYIIAALISVLILSRMSDLLIRFGNFKTTAGFLAISVASLVGLAFAGHAILALIFFVIHHSLNIVIRTDIDVFVEEFTDKMQVGAIRGFFLTVTNLAWVIAPLIVALILGGDNFERLFIFAALMGTVVIALMFTEVKGTRELVYRRVPFWRSAKALLRNRDLSGIFISRFLFNVFVSTSTIYIPIYLHYQIGFAWSSIGVMFTLMLLPYVLLDVPFGRLADKYLGEQELLAVGFVLMGVCALTMSLITTPVFVIWAFILFMSRVGGSAVETMTETYFFKKVNPNDTAALEFFRDSEPLAYIIAPAIASLLLLAIDVRGLLAVVGLVMFSGIWFAFRIKDTR